MKKLYPNLMMKAASSKSESKKRKRDDSQGSITESAKKAKVHAQRKFAQGAAFNSPVITPIKDKVRPPAAVSSSGPILTGKCPNTEDFLTFLCFRRTSILPAKLDFFKDGFGLEIDSSLTPAKANSSANHKSAVEQSGKHGNKKTDKNVEKKKVQAPAVQALCRKYKEQRLAKEKSTNVTILAKKVKGKNMVRTRSSVVTEKTKTVKKQLEKDTKNLSGLRSGFKRIQSSTNKVSKKPPKLKHFRAGLRSGGSITTETKTSPEAKSIPMTVKKPEAKKPKVEVLETKTKLNKKKKTEGFSDFSSDDNEPLLAVKKPKTSAKTPAKGESGKNQNKTAVKTRSRMNDATTSKVLLRPTRKTKEAAALYMEMITKKLVSPEKSGDEDLSSVDSFPELPNTKLAEQRETEIKAKALTSKKPELKQSTEEKTKEAKKILSRKNDQTAKPETKISKDAILKKLTQKKEAKTNSKRDVGGEGETVSVKRSNRAAVKEEPTKAKQPEGQKKELTRPSTRSRPQECSTSGRKASLKVTSKSKLKTSQQKELEKRSNEKPSVVKKAKTNKEEKAKPKNKTEQTDLTSDSNQKDQETWPKACSGQPEKQEQPKDMRKAIEKKVAEKNETKLKEEKTGRKRKTSIKPVERFTEVIKSKTTERKPEKKIKKDEEKIDEGNMNKRPTRKCSTANKIWIDIDEFTSDEDDFLEVSSLMKTRAWAKKLSPTNENPSQSTEPVKKSVKLGILVSSKFKNDKAKETVMKLDDKKSEGKKTKVESKPQKSSAETSSQGEKKKIEIEAIKNEEGNSKAADKQKQKSKPKPEKKVNLEVMSEAVKQSKKMIDVKGEKKEIADTLLQVQKKQTEKDTKKVDRKETTSGIEISEEEVLERKTKNFRKSSNKDEESESEKRTRPVRQCSTGEKKWIETDSDSFSFYETTDDEDNLPIVDFSKTKSSPVAKDSNTPEKEPKENESQTNKLVEDNFSESDEEPLKKKAHVEEISNRAESVVKTQREVPALTPIKKPPNETHVQTNIPSGPKPGRTEPAHLPTIIPTEPKSLFYERKTPNQSSGPVIREIEIPKFSSEPSLVSVPNRIEMILHSLKRDKMTENPPSCSNDVKVTFGTVPYQPVPHCSQTNQIPCSYQVKATFPLQREPISTHGLDLLSEVALPTTPKESLTSQTKRIEKWLNDSLTVEQKETRFPSIENVEYKSGDRISQSDPEKQQQEAEYYFRKSVSTSPGHSEFQKFGHMELLESQKLLKKNLFAAEVKQDTGKMEPQFTPKKAVTSIQDLLKLQKERKETAKPTDNAPHSKSCKCNNCIVKKGWFKNKPVPKTDHQKSSSVDDEGSKPFESLTKAFIGDVKNSKMSVSVAPIVLSPSSTSSTSKDGKEKKGIFHQRKLSFLERMKERERKEAAVAAAKPSPNAFSPNNESSVYAFEPEPEQSTGINAPFRSKTREGRTSSSSKSDDEGLKICEEETSTNSLGTQVEKTTLDKSVKPSQSASIAVQVNLDSETVAEVEPPPELQDGKSIEISTQTEVPEEDSDSPMFYIPLQQTTTTGSSASSDQQLIQGVALKLGTEGPMGPNQRVIMKAKLVTKPPDSPSIKAVVMPQPKRMFDQKYNNPPIGTVQPTTRKPPNESVANKSESATPLVSVKESSEQVSRSSDSELSKTTKTPAGKPLKNKEKAQTLNKDKPEVIDESTPSSSLTSGKTKRPTKQKIADSVINPTNSTWLPPAGTPSKLVEAPTFHPTEKDFQDPFEFFDRIRPAAEKFGLCRIVPPSNFKPDCKVSDDMRFTAYNQYVHRMFHRWGPNIKEMMAIKKYLATQSISLKQPPWIGGIEVDLPRLYQSVQNCGGLMKVMEKKKWHQVADMMKIPKAAQDRVTKLDDIYCKYLLPYDTLSHDERQKLFDEVEKDWEERQKTPVELPDTQQEDEETEENYIEECEECVVRGRNMALNQFYRIARNTMSMWFRNPEPSPREVETEFWKHVSERNHHVCVHSGSIDSSGWGYGFPIAKNNSFSKHPWNLKVLTNNSGSVLRYLGPVMGVTVPTLHVGMVFTAFCWYRDPHGLPWIEYLHTGAPKIWYGISDDNSTVFQEALTKLLPRYIKNKTIWLPSDTGMIPPELLVEHGVSLCHTVQEPGQFILVFPRAFTSSICTGYLVSESVYFAQLSWLATAEQVFKDIQESCEPSMFSLEKLLFSIATDTRSSVEVLKQVLPMVWHVRQKELDGRKTLVNLGLKSSERLPAKESESKKKKGRWAQEDDGDYECEICRTNLYVSLVTNSQEEGVYCLPHAIELLTQKRHQLKYCKLMYTYTQEEMNEMVEKLEQRIESKSQKKPQSKPSTSAK